MIGPLVTFDIGNIRNIGSSIFGRSKFRPSTYNSYKFLNSSKSIRIDTNSIPVSLNEIASGR